MFMTNPGALGAIMAAASMGSAYVGGYAHSHKDTYFVPPRRGSITRKGQPTRRRRGK